MPTAYFTPDTLRFLDELRGHNHRDWFQKNKQRYERSARDPMLALIGDLAAPLKKISPHFVADPAPTGGSMMRIYRDTRFAKDKSPYKTALAAHFWHQRAKQGATPAFHLRIEPGNSSVGCGIWQPEPGALKRIRSAIAGDAKGWQKVVKRRELGSGCGMIGESLKRPPPGFAADHPCIDDLKRKDFGLAAPLDDRKIATPAFLGYLVKELDSVAPFLEFLTRAVGLPF